MMQNQDMVRWLVLQQFILGLHDRHRQAESNHVSAWSIVPQMDPDERDIRERAAWIKEHLEDQQSTE